MCLHSSLSELASAAMAGLTKSSILFCLAIS